MRVSPEEIAPDAFTQGSETMNLTIESHGIGYKLSFKSMKGEGWVTTQDVKSILEYTKIILAPDDFISRDELTAEGFF